MSRGADKPGSSRFVQLYGAERLVTCSYGNLKGNKKGRMTTTRLIAMAGLYLGVFAGVAYLTRAKMPRIAGALCGSAVFGVAGLLALSLGEAQGWWRVPKAGSSHFRLLLWLALAVSCTPIYLITWRVARRFGGRGLAVFVLAAAVVGPARDYMVATKFPEWIAFSPGITPILAVAMLYAFLVAAGHTVMGIVSGPAQGDALARRSAGCHAENSPE